MKKILIGLMLVGCGAQTPEEITADEYAQSFAKECVYVYGDMCNQVRLEVFVKGETGGCWTETGSIKRGLSLTESLIKSNNKTEIYKQMLDCTVFATENTVNFLEFIEKTKGH